ncbi:hypothetical protein ABWH74_003186, partial [Burkholderia vietnamiensis]
MIEHAPFVGLNVAGCVLAETNAAAIDAMRATRAASTSTPTSTPAAKPRYRRRSPGLLMGASSAGHQQKRLPPANGLAGVSLR